MQNSQKEGRPSPLWRALGLETPNEGRRTGDRIVKLLGDFIFWAMVFIGVGAFLIGNGLGLIALVRYLLRR